MSKKYKDLMLDIETAGRTPGVAIIQIAAVPFDVNTGEISNNTFCKSINLQHQFDNKFSFDGETMSWWKKTNPSLFKELSESKLTYNIVGKEFQDYFKSLPNYKNIRVWGNSNRFDLGLLEGWYKRAIGFKFKPFWNTWLEMDCRSISALKPDIKANMKFVGEKHNAIHDCKHQIKYVSQTIKELGITIR